jgi:hypothetical protein
VLLRGLRGSRRCHHKGGTLKIVTGLAVAGIISLAGCSTAAHPTPAVTITKVIKPAPAPAVTRAVPGPTVTKDVNVPGPTVTVSSDADAAQLAYDQNCISGLYNQLSFDAANGHILPQGWWLSYCPTP